MWTVKQTLENLAQQLTAVSDTPRLDAEILLAHVLDKSKTVLFAHPELTLSAAQQTQLQQLITRRLSQEPIAYLTGHKAFWTLDLRVNKNVLIPRPETELLVEWAFSNLPRDNCLRIADLGTGSGAVAIAIASERPHWQIDATDNSAAALAVAKQNANQYDIKNISFYLGEWCHALPRRDYHAIVGNPPYIREQDEQLSMQTQSEPRAALVAGPDGLVAIRRIMIEARSYLLPGGWLVLEHGYDQRDAILQLAAELNYHDVQDHDDLAGLPRMVVCRTPSLSR